jgi:hypothetical protein
MRLISFKVYFALLCFSSLTVSLLIPAFGLRGLSQKVFAKNGGNRTEQRSLDPAFLVCNKLLLVLRVMAKAPPCMELFPGFVLRIQNFRTILHAALLLN